MSCECDCASCTEFCDCLRCSKQETDPLAPPNNRPGLDAIQARIGDYGAFFTDAKRRLSATKKPLNKLIPQAHHDRNHQITVRPEPVEGLNQRFFKESPNLQALGTRDPSDPTIALLDAWSVTADVLTFYRERLTQEAYLRTATDEGSLRELANLVGFKPRPGIAATTHLAYLLDPSAKPVDINPGTKAQTVPLLPGEKMQTFETEEKLSARTEWSQMKPRQSRPRNIDMLDALIRPTLRLTDPSLFVRPGERVLFVFGMKLGYQVVREVLSVKTNIELGFVELTLKPKDGLVQALTEQPDLVNQLLDIQSTIAKGIENADSEEKFKIKVGKHLLNVLSSYFLGTDATGVLSLLGKADPINPGVLFTSIFEESDIPFKIEIVNLVGIFTEMANTALPEPIIPVLTSVDKILSEIRKSAKGEVSSSGFISQQANDGLRSDGVVRIELAQAMMPVFEGSLNPALRVMQPNPLPISPSVYLLRTLASPFGTVAPRKMSNHLGRFTNDEWLLNPQDSQPGAAFLDTVVDGITVDSFAIINSPISSNWQAATDKIGEKDEVSSERLLRFARIRSVQTLQRGSYQLSGKVTRLELANPDPESGEPLRVVFTESKSKQKV